MLYHIICFSQTLTCDDDGDVELAAGDEGGATGRRHVAGFEQWRVAGDCGGAAKRWAGRWVGGATVWRAARRYQ